MFQGKNKKQEIQNIRRELSGEKQVPLNRLAGDCGTEEGEKRSQLIWQTFRIKDCTKVTAVVLGTEHPEFCEGKEAAAGNSQELFESELIPEGTRGLKLDRLSSTHSHYFGGGFERCVGVKLRAFCEDKFEYDSSKGMVKAPAKLLNVLRRMEQKEIANDLIEYEEKARAQMSRSQLKKKADEIASMMSSEARMERSQNEMDIMSGKRPRYASTKMEPDECEDFSGMKGAGKGTGVIGF